MKPSEVCKKVGLSGLEELADIAGVSVQTLNNWHKNPKKRKAFVVLALGAASGKGEIESLMN